MALVPAVDGPASGQPAVPEIYVELLLLGNPQLLQLLPLVFLAASLKKH
jgi:hypothetical protein